MRNGTQFQSTPAFGNFTANTGTSTQSLWGETTGYGYSLGATAPYGVNNTQGYHPLFEALSQTFGVSTPSTTQGLFSTVVHGQALFQSLFENGLVLGPINGGAESFIGNGLEAGQLGAISRFINLVQGVASAQAIAYTKFSNGSNAYGTATGQDYGTNFGTVMGQGYGMGTNQYGPTQSQGFGSVTLTSLIHVRYFDTNSTFVIEAAIVGGNQKNLNVTVVGEEIRIQKTENGTASTSKNIVNQTNYVNASTYYSLPLPNTADPKGITATAKDGILTITLPKSQGISKNVRQITVK